MTASPRINYFKLHINDFLEGTYEMSTEEVGAYILLLVKHYQIGAAGLPGDDKTLSRTAGVTPQKWRHIKDGILQKFEKVGDRWVHRRVSIELSAIKANSEQKQANALKRWETDDATAMQPQCNRNAIHKPIANTSLIYKPPTNYVNMAEDAKYKFEGVVIKITQQDYEKSWYSHFGRWWDRKDFVEQLKSLDKWAYENQVKNWPIAVRTALENKTKGMATKSQMMNL